ncbi:hypothetical protein HNY73_014702 [Argiope bruennichi]|uniref:Uncharacterized protein n=1 Tax=Argiope bruennichi TaxID=94029 RepID=A0A8T0EPU5_ARGBR|nr:hypothetical protein HNY73_014702 [Argiope bruennichi]
MDQDSQDHSGPGTHKDKDHLDLEAQGPSDLEGYEPGGYGPGKSRSWRSKKKERSSSSCSKWAWRNLDQEVKDIWTWKPRPTGPWKPRAIWTGRIRLEHLGPGGLKDMGVPKNRRSKRSAALAVVVDPEDMDQEKQRGPFGPGSQGPLGAWGRAGHRPGGQGRKTGAARSRWPRGEWAGGKLGLEARPSFTEDKAWTSGPEVMDLASQGREGGKAQLAAQKMGPGGRYGPEVKTILGPEAKGHLGWRIRLEHLDLELWTGSQGSGRSKRSSSSSQLVDRRNGPGSQGPSGPGNSRTIWTWRHRDLEVNGPGSQGPGGAEKAQPSRLQASGPGGIWTRRVKGIWPGSQGTIWTWGEAAAAAALQQVDLRRIGTEEVKDHLDLEAKDHWTWKTKGHLDLEDTDWRHWTWRLWTWQSRSWRQQAQAAAAAASGTRRIWTRSQVPYGPEARTIWTWRIWTWRHLRFPVELSRIWTGSQGPGMQALAAAAQLVDPEDMDQEAKGIWTWRIRTWRLWTGKVKGLEEQAQPQHSCSKWAWRIWTGGKSRTIGPGSQADHLDLEARAIWTWRIRTWRLWTWGDKVRGSKNAAGAVQLGDPGGYGPGSQGPSLGLEAPKGPLDLEDLGPGV